MPSEPHRDNGLIELSRRVGACRQCALSQTRSNPVFGSGSPSSQLMFVGEAPGYHEDRQGLPFVGQAGKLLEQLLERIGLTRDEVYIANVLKCRPPGNRDPQPDEIEKCRVHLNAQISIIEPRVICTLGNFATRLLSGRPDGISRVHGKPQPLPGADKKTLLYPVFHPAAALYTPSSLEALKHDFDRLAGLLNEDSGLRPQEKTAVTAGDEPGTPAGTASDGSGTRQLGLF